MALKGVPSIIGTFVSQDLLLLLHLADTLIQSDLQITTIIIIISSSSSNITIMFRFFFITWTSCHIITVFETFYYVFNFFIFQNCLFYFPKKCLIKYYYMSWYIYIYMVICYFVNSFV